jgi:hypothetical protein
MKKIVIIAAAAALFLSACQSGSHSSTAVQQNNSDIPYTVAKNYFVKNTVTQLDNPKIESAEKFEAVFGMATVMGPDGKPSPIDFSKQNVIALVLPETDLATTLAPVSLQNDARGNIVFTYKKTTGAKQSYSTRPSLAIVVNKSASGPVVLKSAE